MSEPLRAKELKEIFKDCNDEAVLLVCIQDKSGKDVITPIYGFDWVHSTAKSNNLLEILGCGMSWNPQTCNIVYLYDDKYNGDKLI